MAVSASDAWQAACPLPPLAWLVGAADQEDESMAGTTIDAATAGFPPSVLPPNALLYTQPPDDATLKFGSAASAALKGHGWQITR